LEEKEEKEKERKEEKKERRLPVLMTLAIEAGNSNSVRKRSRMRIYLLFSWHVRTRSLSL